MKKFSIYSILFIIIILSFSSCSSVDNRSSNTKYLKWEFDVEGQDINNRLSVYGNGYLEFTINNDTVERINIRSLTKRLDLDVISSWHFRTFGDLERDFICSNKLDNEVYQFAYREVGLHSKKKVNEHSIRAILYMRDSTEQVFNVASTFYTFNSITIGELYKKSFIDKKGKMYHLNNPNVFQRFSKIIDPISFNNCDPKKLETIMNKEVVYEEYKQVFESSNSKQTFEDSIKIENLIKYIDELCKSNVYGK